ncbi:MAG TPA: NAD-dependent epimerase/dehydratase family protein [Gaiellaceae bacterium]|nr:NAD-dependent epimerase/dehydratase family protein [Gaiellaceae bacterium]
MSVAVVTGSCGLIGSESASHFGGLGMSVAGVDNDMRASFFGPEASTAASRRRLEERLGSGYEHHDLDIRDREAILRVFERYGKEIELVVHTAAQPSHDWAAREPFTDFDINAVGTLNLLEATRLHAPDSVFVFTSTNKVYGDTPNTLPYVELEQRWELPDEHPWHGGIDETMSIDTSLHSLFGASKVAADVLVQEYGRYFGLRTACFRGGTLTGPNHAAAELHGFLAYVVRCAMTRTPYTIFGYGGKQVRDAIHSSDLIACFEAFYRAPRVAEVYNIGGGRFSNVSVLEAIDLVQEVTGEEMTTAYTDTNRIGDHIWWISDNGRFASHYPEWRQAYDVRAIAAELYERNRAHWTP